MDAPGFQALPKSEIPAVEAIDAFNETATGGGAFLDIAGQWAMRLGLNQPESDELRQTARGIWALWDETPAKALEELKGSLRLARRAAIIRRASEMLPPTGDEYKLGVHVLSRLEERFGLTADSLTRDLVGWFGAPADPSLPLFAADIAAAAGRVFSPPLIEAALGMPLLAQLIEGAIYEISENVKLRLLGKIFDLVEDKYFPDLNEPLPPSIHFYWVKGDMTPAAVSNLCAWAQRAQGTAWQVYLWTDSAITPCLRKTGPILAKAGVTIAEVGEAIDPRLRLCYQEALGFSLPAAADLARLSVLRRMGGVYCDVDIAPGQLDLAKLAPVLSPRAVPRFAPGVRDIRSIRIILSLPADAAVTDAEVRRAVRVQTGNGEINNNFIIIPKNCLFMEPMINDIARRAAGIKGQEWKGDTASAATGPMAIAPVLRRTLAIRDILTTAQAWESLAGQVVTDWPLQWLTPESENQ